jgi:hypothetical protein
MNTEELNRLLEKYYDGASTEDEENILRSFFNGDGIPEGYEAEKAIFGYFTEGSVSIEGPSDLEARIFNRIEKAEKIGQRSLLARSIVPYFGIAAGILIIIGLWFFFNNKRYQDDTFSDPKLAYAETMKILTGISVKMTRTEEALAPVARMNEATSRGLRKISETTAIVENNLKSLEYLQKAIDITKTAKENK